MPSDDTRRCDDTDDDTELDEADRLVWSDIKKQEQSWSVLTPQSSVAEGGKNVVAEAQRLLERIRPSGGQNSGQRVTPVVHYHPTTPTSVEPIEDSLTSMQPSLGPKPSLWPDAKFADDLVYVVLSPDAADPVLVSHARFLDATAVEVVQADLPVDILGLIVSAAVCLTKPVHLFSKLPIRWKGECAVEFTAPLDPSMTLREIVSVSAFFATGKLVGDSKQNPLHLYYRRSMFPSLPPHATGAVYVPPIYPVSRICAATVAEKVSCEMFRLQPKKS
ncbi:MAG: uncharacterized protein KVP18_000590 [Porospora cf. gigantea A]|nr:MAG: hypothetical protein KVP18_000590 [Porospora cf. gigantea A]